MRAHVAGPLHRDAPPLQRVVAPALERARLHAAVRTVRRHRRRVARTLAASRHVLRLHLYVVHVRHARAHVLRRDVAPLQRVDEAPVRAEDQLAHPRLRVPDDHRLPATQVQTRDRRLVRHPARQPQHVDERVLLGRVVPEPGAAQRRPERRVVDRDDAAVLRARIVPEDHLLVAVFRHQLEYPHDSP